MQLKMQTLFHTMFVFSHHHYRIMNITKPSRIPLYWLVYIYVSFAKAGSALFHKTTFQLLLYRWTSIKIPRVCRGWLERATTCRNERISDVNQQLFSPSPFPSVSILSLGHALPPRQGHYTVIAPAWGPTCDAIVVSAHLVACNAPMKSVMKPVGSPATFLPIAYLQASNLGGFAWKQNECRFNICNCSSLLKFAEMSHDRVKSCDWYLTVMFLKLFSLLSGPVTPLKLHLLKWWIIFCLLWIQIPPQCFDCRSSVQLLTPQITSTRGDHLYLCLYDCFCDTATILCTYRVSLCDRDFSCVSLWWGSDVDAAAKWNWRGFSLSLSLSAVWSGRKGLLNVETLAQSTL